MGKWTLRVDAGERRAVRCNRDGKVHEYSPGLCDSYGCPYIVEEHQVYKKPEESNVPEFTIEVAYKTTDRVGDAVRPGWRYVIKWLENGQQMQARDYGYTSKEAALLFAKQAANGIAKQLAPVHVETYTPEI